MLLSCDSRPRRAARSQIPCRPATPLRDARAPARPQASDSADRAPAYFGAPEPSTGWAASYAAMIALVMFTSFTAYSTGLCGLEMSITT